MGGIKEGRNLTPDLFRRLGVSMTARDLARLAGVPENNLARQLSGDRGLSKKRIKRLAKIMGVEPEALRAAHAAQVENRAARERLRAILAA